MNSKHPSQGFTLIELLVVISIIGLLSSVVLASLSNTRVKGKAAAAKSALLSLRNQLELNANGGGYGANTNYALGVGDNTGCGFGAFAAGTITPIKTSLTTNLTAATNYFCSFDVSNGTSPATKWAVAVILPDGSGMVCYDSFGKTRSWPAIAAVGSITTSHINNGSCI